MAAIGNVVSVLFGIRQDFEFHFKESSFCHELRLSLTPWRVLKLSFFHLCV